MRKYQIPDFKIGDRVAYSVQFLASIGMSHTFMGRARGKIIGLDKLGERALVRIQWDNTEDPPVRVLDANLALIGPNPRFANVD